MITLYFRHPQTMEIMMFKIVGKVITYSDKVWKGFQLFPKDEVFFSKLSRSQQKQFNLTDKDKAEYEKAETEEDLAKIIIEDCKSQGCSLIARDNKE